LSIKTDHQDNIKNSNLLQLISTKVKFKYKAVYKRFRWMSCAFSMQIAGETN